jgi:hypothetical protein
MPGIAFSIASRSRSRSCQIRRCAAGSSARSSIIFAIRASILSRFSRLASMTPIASFLSNRPCPALSSPAIA